MAAPKHSDTPKAPDLRQRAAGLRDELAKPRKRQAAPQAVPEPIAATAVPTRASAPNNSTPARTDPAISAVVAHRAAYAAWRPHLDAIGKAPGGSPQFIAAEVRGEPSCVAEGDAFHAAITARPTTATGLRALAEYLPEAVRANGISDDDNDALMALRTVCAGVLDLVEVLDVPHAPATPDPFLTAVANARAADSAVAAFEVRIEDQKPDDWIEQETALCAEQRRTRNIALATVPTTRAGQIALVDYLAELVRQHGYANGDPPDDESEIWREGYRALAAALRVAVSPDDEPEAEELATIEKMSVLDFGAYDFDTPLRDPGAWSKAFATHAIGMHIADKTLRMTKPEMVAFITDAGGRDDEVPSILFKAMDAAQETFEGWGKLLATASARYRVAGSVAVIADAATGEA